MTEILELLQSLESTLAKRLDAMVVSQTSKLPWKAILYAQTLAWRIAELGRSALDNFEKDRLVAAIILTRACMETSAALWYLCGKLSAAVDTNCVGDIDDYLMRLIMGNKVDEVFPQAVNVLNFVDRVDKDVKDFRHQYDVLSEYVHPNWAGTSLIYAKHNEKTRVTDFGQNIRNADHTRQIGILNLSVVLQMFDLSYKRMTDLVPAFTALCDSQMGQ